jgi:hypothetical protein
MQIGIKPVPKIVTRGMRSQTIESNTEFAELRQAYELAWQRFSAAVAARQALSSEASAEALTREAETAVCLAQQDYRQARNALAERLSVHSAKLSLSVS